MTPYELIRSIVKHFPCLNHMQNACLCYKTTHFASHITHTHSHTHQHYPILIWNYNHYLWLLCVGNPIKMICPIIWAADTHHACTCIPSTPRITRASNERTYFELDASFMVFWLVLCHNATRLIIIYRIVFKWMFSLVALQKTAFEMYFCSTHAQHTHITIHSFLRLNRVLRLQSNTYSTNTTSDNIQYLL